MKLDLEFVELHTSLFIDGINFGLKLYTDPKKNKAPITMWYDTELRHVVVVCKSKVALVETTASMTLAKPEQVGVTVEKSTKSTVNPYVSHAEVVGTAVRAQVSGPGVGLKQTAQVSTPMDKVQGVIVRKKAKYQGEESQGE